MKCLYITARFVIGMAGAVVATSAISRPASAQDLALAERAPKFFYAASSRARPFEVDASRTTMLKQVVSLNLEHPTVGRLLGAIERQTGLHFAFNRLLLAPDRPVTLRADTITVGAALLSILMDTQLDVLIGAGNQVALVERSVVRPPAPAVGAITGSVTDAASGQPVGRAQVVVDATGRGAVADDSGRYTIASVPAGAHRVSARRVGYAPSTREITVTDGAIVTADFRLTRTAATLDQVVTTVTGAQRRAEVGNAIGTIAASDVVQDAPVMSLTDVLNARVSNVQVITQAGNTGMSPRIRIRGVNSLYSFAPVGAIVGAGSPSNEPLIVIDGVRADNSPTQPSASGMVFPALGLRPGRLNDLNPQEIENVEIVKGPSAATLYGTDAANGVILITTKRGRIGTPQWSAVSELGTITEPASFPDAYFPWGHSPAGATVKCPINLQLSRACVVDSIKHYNVLNDPAATPLGRGNRSLYGLQVRGGATQMSYFLSGEREEENGVMKMPEPEVQRLLVERGVSKLPGDQVRPNAMAKTSGRANLSFPMGEKATVAISSGLVSYYVRNPGNIPLSAAMSGPGDPTQNRGYGTFGSMPGEAFARRSSDDAMHFLGSGTWSYVPADWLSFRGALGSDVTTSAYEELQRRDEGPAAYRTGWKFNARFGTVLTTVDASGTARRPVTSHWTSNTSAGVQYNKRSERQTYAYATGLAPGAETVAGGGALAGGEATVESVVAGTYVQQEMALDERLFVTGALRFDGGSAFGRNFKTATYPKASVSWIALGHRDGLVSTLRLRAAYGASGVQPGATAALPLMTLTNAVVDAATVPGGVISSIGNAGVRPERQREFESGFDAAMLGERIRVEGSYYRRQSSDALFNVPIAPSAGISSRQENIGSIRNEGVEASINAHVVAKRAFTWDVDLNGGLNRNRIVTLNKALDNVTVTNQEFSGLRQGYPLYSIYARPIRGFADANGNGIIEASEITVGDSSVYGGTRMPKTQLTASTTLSFLDGHLRASTLVDYRGGFALVNRTFSLCTSFLNCRPANDVSSRLADQTALVAASTAAFNRTTWGFFEDGSFARWRELSVAWDLPSSLLQRARVARATLVLSGRNLGIRTHYRGPDPEVANTSGLGEAYFEDGTTLPPVRYWIVRLNLGF